MYKLQELKMYKVVVLALVIFAACNSLESYENKFEGYFHNQLKLISEAYKQKICL